MLNFARLLAIASILLAVVAVDSWHMHLLPWGRDAARFVIGASFVSSLLVALGAILIVAIRAYFGRHEGYTQIVSLSSVTLITLGILAL